MKQWIFLLLSISMILVTKVDASKLEYLKVLDKDYIHIFFRDGEVIFDEAKRGKDANKLIMFGETLNTNDVSLNSNWTITSTDDKDYSSPQKPVIVNRKSKVSCMAQMDWNMTTNDFNYEWAYEHNVFLALPYQLKQGKNYTLKISNNLNSDKQSINFKYDIFSTKSEAIKINLAGYSTQSSIKKADLYMWLGDGGARDYSSFTGKKVYIFDVNSKKSKEVGKIYFHSKKSEETTEKHNMLQTDVWSGDFSRFSTPGKYRIAIEDVGCSEDFEISKDAYKEPFKVSLLGYYYMRIGENISANSPTPRQPAYIPGKDPEDTIVYVTEMNPYHPEWNTFLGGSKWDKGEAWLPYVLEGKPSNPNAYGGHSDAKDWDRHLAHVTNIYDMLLPYFLTNGSINDDNVGIPESGNGIPDIIDEARNEVDFWLRLRYKDGYSHGLTNPAKIDGKKTNIFFQAGNTTMAAWANAANSAMLANCFLISGHKDLMKFYLDSALEAFNYATKQNDIAMLSQKQEIGQGNMTGNDFRMTAAAFLYNLTGDKKYETIIKEVSNVTNSTSEIATKDFNQIYATAAYLGTKQKVNNKDLYKNMKSSMLYQAKMKEADYAYTRPSRRASDNNIGWFVSEIGVLRTIVAHTFADSKSDKEYLLNALISEYDWTLGRNSLNMIQMTTATTSLESKRSVENAYTSGWDDGTPGVHPGHTPYFNIYDWWQGMVMGMPSWMTSKCYPRAFDPEIKNMDQRPPALEWPQAELYFNTRYVYCANEFTPRQTMRGKMALYTYLYGSK